MLPQPQTLRAARRAWHDFYNLLLTKGEKKRISRVITRGQRAGLCQVVLVPVKPFSTGCKDTGSLLIKRALDALHQFQEVQFLRDTNTGEIPDGVVIEVNCVELGKKRSLSRRTIYNHIRELIDAGLIIEKKFHGWRRNLELIISSTWLYKIAQNPQKVEPKCAEKDRQSGNYQPSYGTKLPPIEAQNNLVITTLTGEVEKLKSTLTPEKKAFKARAVGANGADAEGDEAPPKRVNKGAGGRLKALLSRQAPEKVALQVSAAEAEKARLLASFSEELFTKANRLLYKRNFSAHEYQLALDAIAAGVYRHLDTDQLSLGQWQQYHRGCLERVRLAANWFARHTDAEISWPYALYSNGLGYFDPRNPNGFIATERWLAENEAKKQYSRIKKALQAAETEFKQWRDLARGLQIKVCQRVRELDAWGLYRWHENRIRELGRESALKRFYAMAGASAAGR